LKFIKKLYNWVLHWAETPYGPVALFLLSFAEASFFPVPPDVLLIALCLGARSRSFIFAVTCSIASVLGAVLGYSIGYFVWWSGEGQFSGLAQFFFSYIPGFSTDIFYQVQAEYEKWKFWIIFTAGFTFIPYKIFTISAGAFDIDFVMFMVASAISRSARFFLVAGLIWKFGNPIRGFIDKYFNLLAFLFGFLK
jgi:membrane protein YqaA with SNARE-associated domain